MNKVYIIGIGFRPLDGKAREIVLNSGLILASRRLVEVFREYEEYDTVKDAIKVINNIDETIAYMKAALEDPGRGSIVLLGSGDPLFFGIGRRAVEELGPEAVEVLPDLSSIQIAFARINEPWDDALLLSLHGGPDPKKRRRLRFGPEDIPALTEAYEKIAVLTDMTNNPAVVAKNILERGRAGHLVLYVCEKLGYPDERITRGTPEEIAGMVFSDPNVLILKRSPGESAGGAGPRFGIREEDISYSRGLLTKDEIRAVSVHKLRLPETGVLWDIGSGSGSVSTEAARLSPLLRVCAVEKDEEQVRHIRENRARFSCGNIEVFLGEAPGALRELPHPHRVFIGGSGGRLAEIVDSVGEVMPAGIMVINAVTIETLQEAVASLERNGFRAEITEVSISRSKVIAGRKQMAALNPVFIITGERNT